ncbi:MAG: AI-2E family transporter [Gammaproteobacteria bacterium]|nr:AI-2E family transporter [Gammaproteobacteria bacterium]
MQFLDNQAASGSAYFQTFKTFVFVVGFILACFYLFSSILLPIIISFTLYALIQPLTSYLVRKDINHSLAIIIIFILMLVASILAISIALPQLFGQVAILKSKLPAIISQFEIFLNIYSQKLGDFIGIEINNSEVLVSFLSQSTSLGNTLLVSISEQIFSITLGLILVPLLTYFILKDFKSLRNKMMNWLPNPSFELGWMIYYGVTSQLQVYIRGVMIQSFIMAIVASLGFYLIGLDIPILLGSLTGLLNLIPYIGPLISMLLAVLVASAMMPFDPSIIYLAVGVIIVAQIVDNAIVIPAVIANAVDLHPVLVIVGILIFGNIFGTIGVILAIPAMATAKIIYINLYTDIYNASQNRFT